MNYSWKHSKGTTSKYHSVKTEVDGIMFDSRKEAQRYSELKLLERAGVIHDLQLQVPFQLIPKTPVGRAVKYYADFVYYEGDKMVVEDTKGMKTEVYKIKKKLMYMIHGIEVKEK